MMRIRQRLLSSVVRGGLLMLSRTWRYSEEIPSGVEAILSGESIAVIAFWHGKMFPIWFRFRNRDLTALISGSRDGELLAEYLERNLGYIDIIRGSSSKGGREALGRMVDRLANRSVLITPDGPRGPKGEAKPGALIAAGRSGRPVLLVGWQANRSVRLRSWDAMDVPYPFAKINFRYCILPPPTNTRTTTTELDAFRLQLTSLSQNSPEIS